MEVIISKQNGGWRINGTLITDSVAADVIKSGLNKIWVSIDGPPETHDQLRGVNGTYAKAFRGLTNLIKAKKEADSDILIDLAVTISSLNYRLLPDIIENVKDLDLYQINVRHMGVFFEEDIENLNKVVGEPFQLGLKKGDLCFSEGDQIVLAPDQAREFRTILYESVRQCDEYGINLHYEPDLMTVVDWRKGKTIKSCLHLWTQINVNAQGDVIPCLWYDKLIMGNIHNQSLKDIWNNEFACHLRKNFKKISACSKCCYFYLTLTQNAKRALEVANFPFKSLLKL